MISPRTTEEQWVVPLSNLQEFASDSGPMVVVSPHPDDETLAAGGLIAAATDSGRDVLVIAVTDGERAYESNEGLAEIRVREQENALRLLSGGKARMVRLGLPDSAVETRLHKLQDALRNYIRPESNVIAPWLHDYHPDHEACGRAAQAVARAVGAKLTWWYFWTWHRGTPEDLYRVQACRFTLSPEHLRRKLTALSCHASQLERGNEEPILPERLLAPAHRPFEVFAKA